MTETAQLIEVGAIDCDARSAAEAERDMRRNHHWVEALDQMPPIRVRRTGDRFFCVDGHHRIRAAIALGRLAIRAVFRP